MSQVTTVFTHRNVNIESIAASPSAIEGIHKYTIMVKNDPERVANLVKQIEKKVDVLKREQLNGNPDLMNEILKDGVKIYG